MKTVKFETVRELALALLDGRRFSILLDGKPSDSSIRFDDARGFVYDDEAYDLEDFTGFDLLEIPNPRHHAELIKAWAEDGNLIVERLRSGNIWTGFDSTTFVDSLTYRLVDRSGNVIMVSWGKQ